MAVRDNGFDAFEEVGDGATRRASDPFAKSRSRRSRAAVEMRPSDWVSRFIRIKDGNTGQVSRISFDERKYLKRPYDTAARRILFMTSRQTEKSTTVGNKLFAVSGMRPFYESLFVSPSAMQTTVFSRGRLDDIVEISPLLQSMVTKGNTWNILEKEFANKSKIYLRYAFLSADRIRGLSVNAIFGDEIQDLLMSVMPVIEETASHHKNPLYVYSGTPKTLDNNIEKYWSESSTQSEWAIPCTRHGLPKRPGTWHWNVLGPKNLGKKGPICDRCGHAINPEHPYARWIEMNPGAEFEGYRICRLMVPWYWKDPAKWLEILNAYERYPTPQFMNEVLAISYDAGTKPITRAEVIRACDDKYNNTIEQAVKIAQSTPCYFGLDWGTGERAYSVLTVSAYCRDDDALQVIYMHRFDGPFTDPELQLDEIEKLIGQLRPMYVGADYGMGFYQNKRLTSKYGPRRLHQFQYAARLPNKVAYSAKLHRYMVFRTPIMADVFHALKRGKIRLPSWERIKKPYGSDILSIFSEFSETMKMIKYDKPRGVTDDTYHSIIYSLLASMLHHKRLDIIAPIQERSSAGAEVEMDLMMGSAEQGFDRW